jgi:hypothetical protein
MFSGALLYCRVLLLCGLNLSQPNGLVWKSFEELFDGLSIARPRASTWPGANLVLPKYLPEPGFAAYSLWPSTPNRA